MQYDSHMTLDSRLMSKVKRIQKTAASEAFRIRLGCDEKGTERFHERGAR